jgi:hypothetical protein
VLPREAPGFCSPPSPVSGGVVIRSRMAAPVGLQHAPPLRRHG